MIKESFISIQNFTLGLGVLSYFIFKCIGYYNPFVEWLRNNVILYCILFYVIINVGIYIIYQNEDWQVAVRACFIGTVCGIGIMSSVLCTASYKPFGWYIFILSIFHFSEYFTTSITNPSTLSLDSFLLNHSVVYWLAAAISWVEFFIERYFFPFCKEYWYISIIGGVLCILGESMRKLAMITASSNFNHVVQVKKQEHHELVTRGVYKLSRHPSYVGWFWWSVGTQILMINPICVICYAIASWNFFNARIKFEEMTLIAFFGEKYLDYKKNVGTGLPFISGYNNIKN